MTHSDDNGLVLPPNLAPIQVVIVPIHKTDEQLEAISAQVGELTKELRKLGISVKYDDRDTQRPGFKFAEYELKGDPVRLAIGPKDLENGTYEVARRDTLSKEVVTKEGIVITSYSIHYTKLYDRFGRWRYTLPLDRVWSRAVRGDGLARPARGSPSRHSAK